MNKAHELISRTRKRSESFLLMISELAKKTSPLIIETGCSRTPNNFDGDGMSTLIFDSFVSEHGGECYSVDINRSHVEFAQRHTRNVNIKVQDSVKFLYELNKNLQNRNRKVDLLYLDSYDFDESNTHLSSFHHIKELMVIWPSLVKDTVIAVDDNFENGKGKGQYVREFLSNIGIEPIYSGYQIVWKL